MVPSLCRFFDNFNILTPNNQIQLALPRPINMTTMIRQNTKFPLLLDPPDRPDHKAIHCPTVNFGPISSDSVTNSILITGFDTYLTPMSPGAWV